MSSGTVRAATGIAGLDEILNGGIPQGRVVLVAGGPGTGKTILATQFLVNGIKKYGENAVFVGLDESKQHYYSEMKKFNWDLSRLEEENKFAFVDASLIRKMPEEVSIGKKTIGKREFSIISLVEGLRSAAKSIHARRIALDPIASLIFQYSDIVHRRNAVLDLVEALVGTGATCIVTSELRYSAQPGTERSLEPEEFLAHGVILLHTTQVGRTLVRVIQVEKMRETAVDMQPHPYMISETGIEVLAKESVY